MAQIANDKQVDNLSGKFQKRNEPNFALANVLSTFLGLPRLRGLWPMGIEDGSNVIDQSGQGRALTQDGSPTFPTTGLVSYVNLPTNSDYLHRASEAGIQITGALTAGGWFRTARAATLSFINKWNQSAVNYRSWTIRRITGTLIARALVSSNGTLETRVDGGVIPDNTWTFLAMRYTPSTELAIFVNRAKSVNTTSIPAAIYNNTSVFLRFGQEAGPANIMVGDAFMGFLCAAAVPDAMLYNCYEQSRALFGA